MAAAVGANPSTPARILIRLANDDFFGVREGVAKIPQFNQYMSSRFSISIRSAYSTDLTEWAYPGSNFAREDGVSKLVRVGYRAVHALLRSDRFRSAARFSASQANIWCYKPESPPSLGL